MSDFFERTWGPRDRGAARRDFEDPVATCLFVIPSIVADEV
jgi:hypothetical protein